MYGRIHGIVCAVAALSAAACLARLEVALESPGIGDATAAFAQAVERVRAAGGGTIRLANGIYHFRSPRKETCHVSNHHNPNPRNVFLSLTNLADVCVEGGNAHFVFHGEGMGLMVRNCTRLSVRGVSFDYDDPYFAEARFTGFDGGRPLLECRAPFSLSVDKEGNLVSQGRGWTNRPRLLGVFAGETGIFRGWRWIPGKAASLGEGRFRVEDDWRALGFAAKMAKGDVVQIRDPFRPNPTIFIDRCVDVRLVDSPVHASPGIGVLAQRTRDVTVRGTGRADDRRAGAFASPGGKRLTALQADATHFSNCAGTITVENCLFEGTSDDAINVHATCLLIDALPARNRLVCRYVHPCSVGFEVFRPGEHVRAIHSRTLEDVERVVEVRTARMLAADRVELTLAQDLPDGIGVGDAVENADWQPTVVFRGNVVRNMTPRGTLFTTRGRVLCEDNRFEQVAGQPIHIEGDAREWYESGGCRDVIIRRNVFRNCLLDGGQGLFRIAPNVAEMNRQKVRYHRNIVIEDNVFDQFKTTLLYARGVSNLVWRANRVMWNATRADEGRRTFDVESCEDVKIEEGERFALDGEEIEDLQYNPVPAIGQNAQNQTAYDPAKKGPRVLFVGNSITLHGSRPGIGWTVSWGMAATARDKDYVHLLQKRIASIQPEAQCCLMQVADTFERAFYKPDWSCEKEYAWAREFKPDIIVLFFGANVPHEYDQKTMTPQPARSFGDALEMLRTYLDPDGKAFVLVSGGFYSRPKLEEEKIAMAKRHGDVYVDLKEVQNTRAAYGKYNHPGDVGMRMIADRYWKHLEPVVTGFGSRR